MTVKIGKIKDYFLSGHSQNGYVSFINEVLREYFRIFFVIGGTQQIKSRIFRNVGLNLVDRGINVDFLHGIINSDNLEGILIPDLKTALVDGDKCNKGNLTVILIDLNAFINKNKFETYRSKINDVKEQIDVNLELLYEEFKEENLNQESYYQMEKIIEQISKSFFEPNKGKIINKFAQCLTAKGVVSYYQDILKKIDKMYFLKSIDLKEASFVLKSIAREANLKGLEVEVYRNFLDWEIVELITINERNVGLGINLINNKNCIREMEIIKTNDNLEIVSEDKLNIDLNPKIKKLAEVNELVDLLGDLYQEVIDFVELEKLEKCILDKIIS